MPLPGLPVPLLPKAGAVRRDELPQDHAEAVDIHLARHLGGLAPAHKQLLSQQYPASVNNVQQ